MAVHSFRVRGFIPANKQALVPLQGRRSYVIMSQDRWMDGQKGATVRRRLTVGARGESLGVDALLVVGAHLVDHLHLPGLEQALHLSPRETPRAIPVAVLIM